jgi:hypothetical protein
MNEALNFGDEMLKGVRTWKQEEKYGGQYIYHGRSTSESLAEGDTAVTDLTKP